MVFPGRSEASGRSEFSSAVEARSDSRLLSSSATGSSSATDSSFGPRFLQPAAFPGELVATPSINLHDHGTTSSERDPLPPARGGGCVTPTITSCSRATLSRGFGRGASRSSRSEGAGRGPGASTARTQSAAGQSSLLTPWDESDGEDGEHSEEVELIDRRGTEEGGGARGGEGDPDGADCGQEDEDPDEQYEFVTDWRGKQERRVRKSPQKRMEEILKKHHKFLGGSRIRLSRVYWGGTFRLLVVLVFMLVAMLGGIGIGVWVGLRHEQRHDELLRLLVRQHNQTVELTKQQNELLQEMQESQKKSGGFLEDLGKLVESVGSSVATIAAAPIKAVMNPLTGNGGGGPQQQALGNPNPPGQVASAAAAPVSDVIEVHSSAQ